MNRRQVYVLLAGFIYFLLLSFMIDRVENYIDHKVWELELAIKKDLGTLIGNNHKLVDVVYTNHPVLYEKTSIPQSSEVMLQPYMLLMNEKYKNIKREEIIQKYDDLESLYRLDYGMSYEFGNKYGNGWALYILENYGSHVQRQVIFPYAVGYKKDANYNSKSIPDCVNNALEFYIENKKSEYSDYFERGSYQRVMNQIFNLSNEYFYIKVNRDENPTSTLSDPLFEKHTGNSGPQCYQDGYFYTNNYKVFLARTPSTYFEIVENRDKIKNNKLLLEIIGFVVLTLLFFVIIRPLLIKEIRYRRVLKESLYEKIKRLSNPEQFIKEYDKEKVDKANIIYQKLLETSPDDIEALKDLIKQAEEELGVNFVDKEKIVVLKKKVNPQKFMKPYQPEKVTLANELYSILNNEDITFEELMEVEEKSKTL